MTSGSGISRGLKRAKSHSVARLFWEEVSFHWSWKFKRHRRTSKGKARYIDGNGKPPNHPKLSMSLYCICFRICKVKVKGPISFGWFISSLLRFQDMSEQNHNRSKTSPCFAKLRRFGVRWCMIAIGQLRGGATFCSRKYHILMPPRRANCQSFSVWVAEVWCYLEPIQCQPWLCRKDAWRYSL